MTCHEGWYQSRAAPLGRSDCVLAKTAADDAADSDFSIFYRERHMVD